MAQRRRKNQDIWVVATGREGDGKSSLALSLALAVTPDLSPADVILDMDDYHRVYDPRARDQTYVLDEAGRILFNRNWNTKSQKNVIQEIMENRQNRNLFFLNLPQFKTLDKYAREGRISVWFGVIDQGVAMVRELVYNVYEEEAYYPIVLDRLYWDALEEQHPDFARVYYRRKHVAHVESFEERKRVTSDSKELEQLRQDYLKERYRNRLETARDKRRKRAGAPRGGT